MSENTHKDTEGEFKLLVLNRIKEPSRANAVMELIAGEHGDNALSRVIDQMEPVDIARLFTSAFDYTKPNQSAALIKPETAVECLMAIAARWNVSRIEQDPASAGKQLNDFLTSVILSRSEEKQLQFRSMVDEHVELLACCLLSDFSYDEDSLDEVVNQGERGTVAEIAANLGLSEKLSQALKDARDHGQKQFMVSNMKEIHGQAVEKFGAETTTSLDEFMDI